MDWLVRGEGFGGIGGIGGIFEPFEGMTGCVAEGRTSDLRNKRQREFAVCAVYRSSALNTASSWVEGEGHGWLWMVIDVGALFY